MKPMAISLHKPTKVSFSASDQPLRKVVVEYLYLDLQVCDRCVESDHQLREVLDVLGPALRLCGYEIEYQRILMANAEIAQQYRFQSSPTIRVNGQDICYTVVENACDCCSEISGVPVDCRVFRYNGEHYEVAPQQMLAEGILRAVFGIADPVPMENVPFLLPDNLARFYESKLNRTGLR